MLAAIRDPWFADEDIFGDNGPAHLFPQFHLGFIFAEFTTTHQNSSTKGLDGVSAFLVTIPLHKSAVAEPNGAAASNFGDLIARPPKGAVYETHRAGVVGPDFHHRGIRTVEGDKLAV